jgi:ABC-2 type transport system permease protein
MTIASTPPPDVALPRAGSRTAITRAQVRAQLLDLFRTPIAIISTTIFPTLAFCFFVLPQGDLVADPMISLVVCAQLALFGVMSAYLFGYGIGIAEDRTNPWTSYVRTLPSGALPIVAGRAAVGAISVVLSLVPLVTAIAFLTAAPEAFTSGELPWWRLAAALAAIVVTGLPFLGLGLIIGYLATPKAAVALAQVLFFPLAFIGGLLLPPQEFPSWVGAISLWTPSRAGRDLLVQALTGETAPATTVPVFVGWMALAGVGALWAHRRDEGRRFR